MIDTPGAFFQHCLTLLGGVAVAEGPGERDARAGTVTLHPHQVEGMHRLLAILARHGGALLADEVGLGKTYTALAVAPSAGRRTPTSPTRCRTTSAPREASVSYTHLTLPTSDLV